MEGVEGKTWWLRSFVAQHAPQDDNVLFVSAKDFWSEFDKKRHYSLRSE